ncbi:MAG: hypothetical protein ABL886_05605 [Rhodoglobus sp.]
MPSAQSSSRRPTAWLAIGATLAAIGIGVLWPLREVGRVCVAIYPPPPGCGAEEPLWAPLVGIAAVLALFCAMVVLYATRPAPRTALTLLAAGMVIVVVLVAAIVGLSQTGIWDPPYPLYID